MARLPLNKCEEVLIENTKEHAAIKRDYFHWLCDLVDIENDDNSYWLLAKDLFRREFYWTVPNDDNRALDGKRLREVFIEGDNDYDDYSCLDSPCSILELLIGIAYRCEEVIDTPDKNYKMSKWFWEMLRNLKLDGFTDEVYYTLGGLTKVDKILDRFLERDYTKSGKGGLFPLRKLHCDQREIEIWYQMSSYLMERYYINNEFVR